MNEIILDVSKVPTPESIDNSSSNCQWVINVIASKLKSLNSIPTKAIRIASPVTDLSRSEKKAIVEAMRNIGWSIAWDYSITWNYFKRSHNKALVILISKFN